VYFGGQVDLQVDLRTPTGSPQTNGKSPDCPDSKVRLAGLRTDRSAEVGGVVLAELIHPLDQIFMANDWLPADPPGRERSPVRPQLLCGGSKTGAADSASVRVRLTGIPTQLVD